MTLQNLYFFCEIIQDMNLGVTAERLYTSQQALSGHIKRLESHFGVKLFDRRPNLLLTEQGKALASEARLILDAESRLFAKFGTGIPKEHGTFAIACGLGRSKYYLLDTIEQFSKQHPSVQVSCVDECNFKELSIFDKDGAELAIGTCHAKLPDIKNIFLFRMVYKIVFSLAFLEQVFGDKTQAFIENGLENGVNLDALPRTIPLIHSNVPVQDRWISNMLPVLEEFPAVQVSYPNSDLLYELCCKGRGMILITNLYANHLLEKTPEAARKNMLFFTCMKNGSPLCRDEYLSYSTAVPHPQYFFDFIDILRRNLLSKGLTE